MSNWNFKDLTGQRFGRLVVVGKDHSDKRKNVIWLCRCDCGNLVKVASAQLNTGHTKSCGCLKRDVTGKRTIARCTTHGKTNTRLFRIWQGMKYRCYNPKCKDYSRYGGRGVVICKEWREDFQAFYDWSMANGYSDNLTIDRKDSNGNYEPSNCRWATVKQQTENKRPYSQWKERKDSKKKKP